MSQEIAEVFEQRLAEYKHLVILRQEECSQTAEVLEEKVRQLSSKGKKFKTTLIVLGVVVATRAALELAMLGFKVPPVVMNILSILFLLIGATVSVLAALEKVNRYEEKAGEGRALSSRNAGTDDALCSSADLAPCRPP
jgi:uncharacterized protein YacL